MNIFESWGKSKAEKSPEFCKHNKPFGNCDDCQMSLEDAQREANLIRAVAKQGGIRKEDFSSGGDSYPSRAEGLKKIKASELSSTSKQYANAEERLSFVRESEHYRSAEEKFKKDLNARPDQVRGEHIAHHTERTAAYIAEAQLKKEERRELYKKLKEEFEPEEKK